MSPSFLVPCSSLLPPFVTPQHFSHFPMEKDHLGPNSCVLHVAVDVVPLIIDVDLLILVVLVFLLFSCASPSSFPSSSSSSSSSSSYSTIVSSFLLVLLISFPSSSSS